MLWIPKHSANKVGSTLCWQQASALNWNHHPKMGKSKAPHFALIQYSVFEKMQVKLAVYDLQGQEIQQIYQGNREIGSYQITVDLARISSGFYIISLSGSNGQRQSRRMIKQ
jgi:hypothetical protein